MSLIKLTLPDGKALQVEKGSTVLQAIEKIGTRLAQAALSASLDGKLVDLSTKLEKDASFKVHTFATIEGKETYWHSTSHLMAYAIQELFPGVKFGTGPAIEEGFYYDVDCSKSFTPEDLIKIEEKMKELAKQNFPVKRIEMRRGEAIKFFDKRNDHYKVEILSELDEDMVSLYEEGKFIDLCTGPHVSSTGKIVAVKLLNISGSYWRGDAKNKQLQRIYGISFPTQKELDEYLKLREEREQRDHRRIGKEMKIFTFNEDVGMGLPLWLPNGEQLFHTLQEYMRREEEMAGYHYVRTPVISKGKMYERTGHIPYYAESMYAPIEIEGENYYLRPMNCPHHHAIFSELVQSYKQLPYRIAEAGSVYRYELSGTMNGIIRTRGFTQNDAHTYVTMNQVADEVVRVLEMNMRIYEKVGLKNYWFRLSLPDFEGHPEKYSGNVERWEAAANELRKAAQRIGKDFIETKDEAAFYGPKIDIQSKNIRGKEETIATVQLDIMVPKRVGLNYTDENDKPAIPVVIHRAILGSYERFIAFLLEQTMGKFPTWLSPIQVKVLPLSEKFREYGEKVWMEMRKNGIRAELDSTDQTLNYRIRNAQLEKVPYMVIVGEKEAEAKTVSIRTREGKQENGMPLEKFISDILNEIKNKE
ncbi:MAG: threonine--tRNA ligase [Candidatus Diapherotrites archaeon]|uniref:Threonine--tRNA ligase n=1 Tax=Candidatus Iainarchaeum sp. TaxID=3101447 RepID=A0A8T4C6U5_9ARCH|nr:threonine--tRNA ligase [Candidatus Diapherotrites archaeon]